jgi:hypothetical protein
MERMYVFEALEGKRILADGVQLYHINDKGA